MVRCPTCSTVVETGTTCSGCGCPWPRDLDAVLAGRFQYVARLGAGTTATIFGAVEIATGNTVVLRVVRGELARSSAFRERFHARGQQLRELQSSHVLAIYELGEADDVLYCAREHADAPTLRHSIECGPRAERADQRDPSPHS